MKERKCLMNTYANLGDRADLLDSITALEKELAARPTRTLFWLYFPSNYIAQRPLMQ